MIVPARRALMAVVLVCGLGACSTPEPDSAMREQARKATTFTHGQQAWRDARAAELTKPDGWTTLIGLHWLEQGAHYFGSDPDNGIRLAMGPAHMGMIERKADRIRFVPERGHALTLDGQPFKGSVQLRSDDDPAGPSVLAFDEGKGLITVIKRGDRYALRVRHADASTRTGFKGIEYWPGGPEWLIVGRFVPNPPGKSITVANIIGTAEDVPNPGAIEFERDGQTHRLEALDQGEDTLFLVFADRTSGKGSYPAGRFLDAPRPDSSGRVLLDFNKTYNPPCAFTAYATCPLPPPENRLNLEVVAGEKAYSFEETKHP
jgi:uncharacterized protein (DUF1684 family)